MARIVFSRTSIRYGEKKTKNIPHRKDIKFDFVDRKESIVNETIANLKALPKTIQDITERGVEIAQITLLNALSRPDFTQKYRDEMINWINVIKVNKDKFIAGVGFDKNGTKCNESMHWNLYFAEYGAGKDGDKRVTGYHSQHRAKQPEGQWRYYFKGKFYETNTSIPVRYFEACRRSIRENVKELLKARKQHKKFIVK